MKHETVNRIAPMPMTARCATPFASSLLSPTSFSGSSLTLTPGQQRTLAEIEAAQEALQPVDRTIAIDRLASCLQLCAPVGMGATERQDWLRIAYATLRDEGIPKDLLLLGTAAARARADHPAKIIPIIMAEIADALAQRRRRIVRAREDFAELTGPKQEEEFERCPGDVAAAIVDEFGLRVKPVKAKPVHSGPPRYPTEADYKALREELGWNG